VVDLGQQRDAAAGQPFDVVRAPERHAAVEARAHHVADEVGQLRVVARARQRAMAHVVLDVELGVLDPVRQVEVQGRLHQATPEHRQQVQPALDQAAHGVEAEILRATRVEDGQAADVHRHGVGLEVQEHRIEAAELAHRNSLHRGSGNSTSRAGSRARRCGRPRP
jgi:hypothetical protein